MNKKLMTVGEIAKKADVSVRTVQYYDQCGLLKASAYSEGGYRLYSDKELVMLHQIKSLKELRLSLSEIKRQIISFDEPRKFLEILKQQKEALTGSIKSLQDTLVSVELLEDEIERTNKVDLSKYAKLIADMRSGHGDFWALGVMEQDLREHINKFSEIEKTDFEEKLMALINTIIDAEKNNIKPESAKGQELTSAFWEMIEGFLDGNWRLLSSLNIFSSKLSGFTNEFAQKWMQVEPFLSEAIKVYFAKLSNQKFE